MTTCPGYSVWVIGRSSAGKTTVGAALTAHLTATGGRVTHVDGEQYRVGLNADLGYSEMDRRESMRRLAWLGRILADVGVATVVSAVAPFRDARDDVRKTVDARRLVIACVEAPTPVLLRRDKDTGKRFYSRRFVATSDRFDEPIDADLRLDTSRLNVTTCVGRIVDALAIRGLG